MRDLDVMARMIGYSQAEQASPFFGQDKWQKWTIPSGDLEIRKRVRLEILIAHSSFGGERDTKDKWQYAHYVY